MNPYKAFVIDKGSPCTLTCAQPKHGAREIRLEAMGFPSEKNGEGFVVIAGLSVSIDVFVIHITCTGSMFIAVARNTRIINIHI